MSLEDRRFDENFSTKSDVSKSIIDFDSRRIAKKSITYKKEKSTLKGSEYIIKEEEITIIEDRISLYHDQDQNLEYERESLIWRFLSPLTILMTIEGALGLFIKKYLLKRDPKAFLFSSVLFDLMSPNLRTVRLGAAGYKALDLIYNFYEDFSVKAQGLKKLCFYDPLLFRTRNAQAVRNRLKLAVKLEVEAFERFLKNGEELRILSIASGSALSILLTLKNLEEKGEDISKIKVRLVDLDPEALIYSRSLAKHFGYESLMEYVNASTTQLDEFTKDFQPHIIEMIGFLDYRPKRKAVELMSRLRMKLRNGGILLTGNIVPNSEQMFMNCVVQWPMLYREPEQAAQLIADAGFNKRNSFLVLEPHKIHTIMWCE